MREVFSRLTKQKSYPFARPGHGPFGVGCLAGGLLGDRPALVAGAVQGVHYCRPIRFAVEQFRALTPGTRGCRLCAEILKVDSIDSFAEQLNPSLRWTVS